LFVYRFIRDHGGFDNWQLIVHEKLAMKDDVEARLRERYWTEHYQATLNSNVPGRTKKEYGAKWQVEHREEHNKWSTAWNLANSARLKEKHNCACGGKFTTANRCLHLKTKLHLAYAAKQ
jgi:hypothetical protein